MTERPRVDAAAMRGLRSFAEIIDLGDQVRRGLNALLDSFDAEPEPPVELPTGATAEWTATTASGAVTLGGVDILFAGSTLACVLNAIDEEWPAARFWWHANADGTLIATIMDRIPIQVVTRG